MPKLNFLPSRDGFHFRNEFIVHAWGGRWNGLCGGMSLAAARYWQHRIPIPTHREGDFRDGSTVPNEGSRLQKYLYDRQMDSYGPLGLVSALNWIVMPGVTPQEQFNWSLSEFQRTKKSG